MPREFARQPPGVVAQGGGRVAAGRLCAVPLACFAQAKRTARRRTFC